MAKSHGWMLFICFSAAEMAAQQKNGRVYDMRWASGAFAAMEPARARFRWARWLSARV